MNEPMVKYFRAISVLTFALMLSVCVTPLQAQSAMPFVSPIFTNNMVLQRGIADPVWGWAQPGQKVTVTLDKYSASGVADTDGKWEVAIGPLPVGGPYTLTVSGDHTVELSNILVGDVWLCSGQSNMQFGIGNVANPQEEISAANNPSIRLFTVASATSSTPSALTSGQWQQVTPDTIQSQGTWSGFSAVGYYFGRQLQADLHVPIGLIESVWGGTPAEAWTSKEALTQNLPEFTSAVDLLTANRHESQAQLDTDWYAKNDPGVAGNWQDPQTDSSAWKPITLPVIFQQAGIPELANINGIVWFRTTLDLPTGDIGKEAVLHEMVDDNDTTWVNGTLVGATRGYNVPRAYQIASSLLKPTGNVIVIRDLDTGGSGGVWGDPSGLNVSFDDGQSVPLAGNWQYRLAANLYQTTPLPSAVDGNPQYPTVLYNGMINPIEQFGIKGVIWYQGENNAGKAIQYRTLLPTMITDWRTRWSEGNFAFLIVQLAGYEPGGRGWAELRQAQWLTAQNLPNVGIVSAIDLGDQTNIHPKNKLEVGRRLALVAEARVYGKHLVYSGPVYKSAVVDGSSIRVRFTQLNGGLVAHGGDSLGGFEIAGADGNFVPANAKIDGTTVIVSSPTVPNPIAVQYDWDGFPVVSLYNKPGLPAFPFKTDEK